MKDTSYRELLIGSGYKRDKRIEPYVFLPGMEPPEGPRQWRGELETLDINPDCQPSIVWDLAVTPWSRREFQRNVPLPPESYDEIHAYEVLEHFGAQGDYRAFFATFSEIWRLLKPGGLVCATCPSRFSEWLWGDPGHTRAVLPSQLLFLNQSQYVAQVGVTDMSDYRRVYRADFDTVASHDNRSKLMFVLQAVKPSRWQP